MIHGSDKSIMINEKIIKKFDIPGNLVDIRQKTNGIIKIILKTVKIFGILKITL